MTEMLKLGKVRRRNTFKGEGMQQGWQTFLQATAKLMTGMTCCEVMPLFLGSCMSVCYLVYLTTFFELHSVEREDDCEGFGRHSWPILRYCPGICLEGLKKATKALG